jgi:hypothetical protein
MSVNFFHPRNVWRSATPPRGSERPVYKDPGVAPEFVKEVEDELSRRLRQPITVTLGDGIAAVGAQRELFAAESVVVMDATPLLAQKRAADWADAVERKVNRLYRRVRDVKQLYAEIQESPSPERTGAIVLEHVSDYDDDFFQALASLAVHDKAHLQLSRARNFEVLGEYLRTVRRRARHGETAAMWTELAQGAAQEKEAGSR